MLLHTICGHDDSHARLVVETVLLDPAFHVARLSDGARCCLLHFLIPLCSLVISKSFGEESVLLTHGRQKEVPSSLN